MLFIISSVVEVLQVVMPPESATSDPPAAATNTAAAIPAVDPTAEAPATLATNKIIMSACTYICRSGTVVARW